MDSTKENSLDGLIFSGLFDGIVDVLDEKMGRIGTLVKTDNQWFLQVGMGKIFKVTDLAEIVKFAETNDGKKQSDRETDLETSRS